MKLLLREQAEAIAAFENDTAPFHLHSSPRTRGPSS
jgi:hypothetical protein